MKVCEVLELLKKYADKYSVNAKSSLVRNNHMNDIKDNEEIDQRVIDAVLVDFINFIGMKNCVDYALYTRDLRDYNMKVQLKLKETLENLYNEDILSDMPKCESFYAIRTLKALTESLSNGYIEVEDKGDGKVYSEKYDIYLYHFSIIDGDQ